MDDSDIQTTRVVIFGQEYVLKSSESDAYAQEISGYVDLKMKKIAGEMNIGDTAKIAIMAALDIADRLLKHRATQDSEQERTIAAVRRLEQLMDGVHKDGEAA
jgi:cell division protein ZapA (FtsZ GTPase activity inhibitor)